MITSLYFNVVSSFSYFQTLPNIDYENNIKIVIFIIIIISQFTCYALYMEYIGKINNYYEDIYIPPYNNTD